MERREQRNIEILEVLFTDLIRFSEPFPRITQMPPHLRRAYVRALVAGIEGYINLTREWALEDHAAGLVAFTREDLLKLREVQIKRDADGNEREIERYWTDIPENVKFSIFIQNALHRTAFRPTFGTGWQALLSVLEMRKRISHPRTRNRLDISDEDLKTVYLASRWFAANTTWDQYGRSLSPEDHPI